MRECGTKQDLDFGCLTESNKRQERNVSTHTSSPLVFIAYARPDSAWKDALVRHLGVYERRGSLRIFVDNRIDWGAPDWETEISDAISHASVIVLVVSSHFFQAKYVMDTELPMIEGRVQAGARVLPLVVSPCGYRANPTVQRLNCNDELSQRGCGIESHDANRILSEVSLKIADFASRAQETPQSLCNDHAGTPAPLPTLTLLLLERFEADPFSLGSRLGIQPAQLDELLSNRPIAVGHFSLNQCMQEFRALCDYGALVTTVAMAAPARIRRGPTGIWLGHVPGGTKDMWMGIHPVTANQYAQALDKSPPLDPLLPATGVSHADALAFCDALNRKLPHASGRYRLPSANEWMLAAAEELALPRSDLPLVAWIGKAEPSRIGRRRPNSLGFLDLLGNVAEWTSSIDNEGKVYRCGGSYKSQLPAYDPCRPLAGDPSSTPVDVGFRLAFTE